MEKEITDKLFLIKNNKGRLDILKNILDFLENKNVCVKHNTSYIIKTRYMLQNENGVAEYLYNRILNETRLTGHTHVIFQYDKE